MKRVRCPKCDNYISFDETKYTAGQKLIFQCNDCGKEFAIRIGVSKLRKLQKDENPDEEAEKGDYGSIVVIENVFHYKQIIPLKLGDNFIGRYHKGNDIVNCPIETVDPSVDYTHCCINVSYDKRGNLKYVLRARSHPYSYNSGLIHCQNVEKQVETNLKSIWEIFVLICNDLF